jgi:hypothetical protein
VPATPPADGVLLSADDILASEDLQPEWVSTPEWYRGDPKGGVFVRGLSGDEYEQWQDENFAPGPDGQAAPTNKRMMARFCALTVCDGGGKRLFSDEQVEALRKKSGATLARVWLVAIRLSGMTKSAVEDAKKNSGTTPSEGSGSS